MTEYDRLKSTMSVENCLLGATLINCERIVSDEDQEKSRLEEIPRSYMMNLR